MKPEIAKIWCEALRSDAYEQGEGRLCSKNNQYCCLGVLCELAIRSGVRLNKYRDPYKNYEIGYSGEFAFLPPTVQEWAGMKTKNGELLSGIKLSLLNDSGSSFKEIADIIEKNAEEL